jgi:hypothetical protein
MNAHNPHCQCPQCYFWRNAQSEAIIIFRALREAINAIEKAAKAWEDKASK